MFRKIAIALVATSVLAAPVLAQGTTQGDKVTSPPTTSIVPKSEKATTKVSKHHVVIRHHRHGAKLAKYTKSHGPKLAKYTKSHGSKMAKYGKYTRPMKHGSTKFMSSARASVKSIPSKPLAKRSLSKSKRGLQ
jgi:hypothetical protein